jgi:hypothetical protein
MNVEKETFAGDRIKITMSAKRLPASRIPFLA